jgi:hypothetical protein
MIHVLDRAAQTGLVAGISLVLQPWWDQGLRVGFFVTLVATVLHIITSHIQMTSETNL